LIESEPPRRTVLTSLGIQTGQLREPKVNVDLRVTRQAAVPQAQHTLRYGSCIVAPAHRWPEPGEYTHPHHVVKRKKSKLELAVQHRRREFLPAPNALDMMLEGRD